MMPIQVPIASMPVHLVCMIEDASVAFVRVATVGVIFEMDGEKKSHLFTDDCFYLNGTEFDYNIRYQYKEIPEMLGWLQNQQLILPTFA